MGKETGFIDYKRENPNKRPVEERIKDYKEIFIPMDYKDVKVQASRCMDCGVAFCSSEFGCPLGNTIPEMNDLVYRGQWKEALDMLLRTNNFPEFTGTVCPALCENACILGLYSESVCNKSMEKSIINKGFEEGYIKAKPPIVRTDKKIAVIGSGPSGLACADQLNKAGHNVIVFERDDNVGGLLTYGIPDFKLEKYVVDRRINLMKEEGIIFKTNMWIGRDYPANYLKREYDVLVLCGGATQARDLPVPGRTLEGLYFAVDYLKQQNKRNRGIEIEENEITAKGKNVVVIGGGDTGNDCIGTAIRQGAKNVYQIDRSSKNSKYKSLDSNKTWPLGPMIFKTSTSHEEGGIRDFSVKTVAFSGEAGKVKKLHAIRMDENYNEIPGTEFEIDCDLVLFAMGFLHPEHESMIYDLGVELDNRGNVKTNSKYQTSVEGVFSAGDMRTGQSLVAKSIAEGRNVAREIDLYLMGNTNLR
ncbi:MULTISPECIES: glutamate synthase subunit beta [unclassified Romboutsia]|uniref:glutamate synthase subunit beta n=1 Tax=unclassified Romboutsia TaxID=2626894 RepID=UPI00082038BA|nr:MULTISPECIES: glutamate synthase subunit beta [unclassified Romboutsia]SCI14953.1 Glutamate synthase [NADPH] small chain [uncultured Clostridium sp.]